MAAKREVDRLAALLVQRAGDFPTKNATSRERTRPIKFCVGGSILGRGWVEVTQ